MLEFALVMSLLVPLFAGMFTLGMALAKGIQVTNVGRDAVVLMVRSNTDPNSGLDLSVTQNQRILIRAATGLGMNLNANYDPDPNGKGVVILSKVVMVGPTECSVGIVPAPSGVPTTTPWGPSNCPNYGQYAFAYRVVIGNGTRWTGTIGAPPAAYCEYRRDHLGCQYRHEHVQSRHQHGRGRHPDAHREHFRNDLGDVCRCQLPEPVLHLSIARDFLQDDFLSRSIS